MTKFRLEDYQDEAICMSFENEEEYNSFTKYLDDNGRRWNIGERYTDWGRFNDYSSMVLYFNNGTRSAEYLAKGNKDKILKYSDFDWSEDMKLEVTTNYKDPKWCEVKDFKDDEWEKAILIADNSTLNLEYPYSIVQHLDEKAFLNGEKVNIVLRRRFARPIPKKEYKPYDEPKFEWVKDGDKVIHTGRVHRISSVGVRENGVWFVGLSFKKAYTTYLNMNQFLDECTWLDGSVCGDKI